MVFYLLLALWIVSGFAIYIYTERTYWDLTDESLFMGIGLSIFGPFLYIIAKIIHSSVGLDDKEERNIAHVRTMADYNAQLNDINIKYGKLPSPAVVDYDYMSNPGDNRIIIRTRNKVIKRLQNGEIL